MKKMAYIAFAALGVIWGNNFLFMKMAVAWITPLQIVFLRVLCGFAPILVFALLRRALHWSHLRHLPHFLVMSLLATTLYYYAYAQGTGRLASGVAGLLSGAIPLFSFVSAAIFLRQEAINRRTVGGLILGFSGVLLSARPWTALAGDAQIDLLGVGCMIAGSLSLGCSFVYARKFLVGKDISPLALSTYQLGLALLELWLLTDFHGILRIQADPVASVGLIVGLGVAGTGVAFMLYYFIVQQLGALKAAGVTYIPPVLALALGSVIADEPLRALDIAAMAAILGGVYLLQSGKAAAGSGAAER